MYPYFKITVGVVLVGALTVALSPHAHILANLVQ
jgi:hypothetical protein